MPIATRATYRPVNCVGAAAVNAAALHTDHCPEDKLDTYVRPLLALSRERVAHDENPLFKSHMKISTSPPYLKLAEISMTGRVVQACHDLGSAARSISA